MARRTTSRVSERVRTHRKAGCAAKERRAIVPTKSVAARTERRCESALGVPESRQGNSPAMDHLLRVVITTTSGLGIKNELPCAIREESHDRQIVSAEAGGRFELIAVLVRSLNAHLVKGGVTVLRLGRVGEDAGGDAA